MRLGRVEFSVSYVVDLDNPDMIAHAEDAIFDDVWMMGKDRDIDRHVVIVEAGPDDTPEDIPEFLREPITEETDR